MQGTPCGPVYLEGCLRLQSSESRRQGAPSLKSQPGSWLGKATSLFPATKVTFLGLTAKCGMGMD